MISISLRRWCNADFATFGTLYLPSGIHLFTVERPWLDNRPSISCIPTGEYLCKPRYYYAGGYQAVEITDVPNRSHILFHVATRAKDVKGCIGIGSELGVIEKEWSVINSRKAFILFMKELGGKEFTLNISK